MSETLTIAILQVGAVADDLDASLEKPEPLVRRASQEGAKLAVLPEFFSREYFCQFRDPKYVEYAESPDGPTYEACRRWARTHSIWLVAGIYEKAAPGLLYDSGVLFDPAGEIRGTFRKAHPSAVRSVEKLYFRGGTEFPVWDVEGWKVGCNICYDIWFPEAAKSSALNGAELLVMPFAAWREPFYPEFFQLRAFENGVYVAVSNKVGREGLPEGSFEQQGRSCVVSPHGEVLAMASESNDDVCVVTIERSAIESARTFAPTYRDRRPEIYGRVTAQQELP